MKISQTISLLMFFHFVLTKSSNELMTSYDVIDFARHFMESQDWHHVTLINGFQNDISAHDFIRLGNGERRYIKNIKRRFEREDQTILFEGEVKELRRKQGFVCFWNSSLVNYLEKVSENDNFKSHYEWLFILEESQSLENLKKDLISINIFIDSEVYVAKEDQNSFIIQVFEIWKIGPGGRFEEELFGEWKPFSGFQRKNHHCKYERRRNMKGFKLRAVTARKDYSALTADISAAFTIFEEILNFTHKTLIEGSWNKIIEMLERKEQDIAYVLLLINLERSLKIDLSLGYRKYSTRLFIKRPTVKPSGKLYFMPFAKGVWISLFFSVILTGLILWFLDKTGSSYMMRNIAYLSPTNAIWNIFILLLQQDTLRVPSMLSCKTLFLVWSMVAFLLISFYSAVLVSFLATLKPIFPFRTMEELKNLPNWKLVFDKYAGMKDSFKLAPEGSIFKEVWKMKVETDLENNLVQSDEEALKKVLRGKYAYPTVNYGVDNVLKKCFTPEEAGQFTDTGEDYFTDRLGFGLQKHSPFSGLFNYFLLKLTQTGHLNRLKKIFYGKIKSEPETDYPRPGFSEVFALFACLGVGLITSLFVLTLEIWINSRKKKSFKCNY